MNLPSLRRGSLQLTDFPLPTFRLSLPVSYKQTLHSAILAITLVPLAAAPKATLPEQHLDFLDAHCLDCHDSATKEGSVDLETLSFSISDIRSAELWQEVLNVVNSGEMPPEKKPRPGDEEKTEFLADLSATLVTAREILSDTGGVTTMRRLNHREYRHTIRDLLGVSIKAESLPADEREGGFDTSGSSLYMSADQIAEYRKQGADALQLAFDLSRTSLEMRKIRLDQEGSFNTRQTYEVQQQVDIQTRFQRWKRQIDLIAAQPRNHKAVAEIRKTIKRPEKFYVHWQKIQGAPAPTEFGFTDGDDAIYYDSQWKWLLPRILEYQSLPQTKTGVYVSASGHATQQVIFGLPGNWPTGDYTMRIHAGVPEERKLKPSRDHLKSYTVPAASHDRRFLDIDSRTGNYHISTHHVRGTTSATVPIEATVSIRGDEQLHLYHLKERGGLEGRSERIHNESTRLKGSRLQPAIWIDYVEFEGPLLDDHTRGQLAIVKGWLDRLDAQGDEAVRSIIREFCDIALRGQPVDPEFLTKLHLIYRDYLSDDHTPHQALRETLAIVLASPRFLYLSETGQVDQTKPLSPIELANRLSYFLWSAPPDSELLQLARSGELAKPEILQQQTTRLLASPRSRTFITAFLGQWLHLDRLDFFQFDPKKHPDFTYGMKKAARREIYETFAYWMNHEQDGSLTQLLQSDTVVIDALLANLYGIANVAGDEFRPVKLPADSPRGGLLGMAAVAAMGSNGDHTSPVERGVWVMKKLMNDPPPPAPPNVPQLSRLADEPLTTREQIAMHQEQPQCAQCHRRIDPIGFGLENFDASGKWRTHDDRHGVPRDRTLIDPSGQIHGGPAFSDFYQLRSHLATLYPDAFATGFAEHLAEYALGRPIGFTDDDLIAAIIAETKAGGYQIKDFIHAVVMSETFRTKR